MKNEYYHIYCNSILGVKTNIRDFKWVYGSVAPDGSFDEYEKCAVKFDITVLSEKELCVPASVDDNFQSYMWDRKSKTLFYRRTMLSKIRIGYNIKICGNTVKVEMGKNYLKFVKQRIMNLHAMYYLLSDIANMLLLKNGYLTLYASAVHYKKDNKGLVCFSPPNTGKTTTAMKLCERDEYSFVSEDIVITDGKKLYSCPYTSSYRAKKSFDTSGSFGRVNMSSSIENIDECDLTDLVILSRSKDRADEDKNDFLRYVQILNGYLFNYYSSPIVKVLGYFEKDFGENWNLCSHNVLSDMVGNCDCYLIRCENFEDFDNIIHAKVSGEN